MNKNIRNLAIAAIFCLPAISGFPQEINETAATETVQAAQEAGGNVNWWIRPPVIP